MTTHGRVPLPPTRLLPQDVGETRSGARISRVAWSQRRGVANSLTFGVKCLCRLPRLLEGGPSRALLLLRRETLVSAHQRPSNATGC